MKLFSKILFVAAAMSAVALVSCNKDNKPSNDEPEFKAPEYVETAKKITVNNVVPTATKQVKEIEFTEAGYAIITYVKTKAETEEEVEVLPYTYENGEYKVPGFGTIKVEGNTVTITTPTQTINATATVSNTEAPQAGTTAFNLYRSWTLYDLKVSVSGGDLPAGVGKLFTYPVTMANIDKWLKEQKVSVPEDVVITNYDIVDVSFTNEGTILINFTKAAPFKGDFKLNGKSFHYDLNGVGNYVFNGSADGTVDFYSENDVDYCSWVVNGKIVNGSKTYKSEITLTLKEK